MTAQTGRTVSRFTDFRLSDSAGTLRSIPVDSINGLGLTYEEKDLTAFQDAIKGALPGTPDIAITITGPFSNNAAAAAGILSGSHTVLAPLNGLSTPLSLDVQVGIGHVWEAGEPQFGCTKSTANGFLVFDYQVDIANGKYSAKLRMAPGSAAPAWGTAAES